MAKISIVVPVYNTEEYLKDCLESLINQTFRDIEIICVNDGSTDNSLNLLHEYSKKDNRIRILNQNSKGVSAARNKGIEVANGEFIMFVDSDDTLETNTCEKLINNFTLNPDVDMIFFQYNKITKDKKEKILNFRKSKNYKELKDKPLNIFDNLDILYENLFYGAAVIYKTKIISSHNIKYPVNVDAAEDHIFIIQILKNNPTIMIIDEYLYNYNKIRENTLSKSGNIKYLHSYKDYHMNKFLPELFDKNTPESEKENKFKLFIYNNYLMRIFDLWKDLYFSKYKKEYIKAVDEVFKGKKELLITEDDVKKMRAYNLYQKFKILSFCHLGYIYIYLFKIFDKIRIWTKTKEH